MRHSIELYNFSFTARHSVAFPENGNDPDGLWFVEDFHAHEFHVSVKMVGALDVSGCVVDFRVARAALKGILDKLEGATILSRWRGARYDVSDGTVAVRYEQTSDERVDHFPLEEVVWFERENTSAELLAEEILKAWLERMALGADKEYSVALTLEEEPSCFATVEMDANDVAAWRAQLRDGRTTPRFVWRRPKA